MDITPKKRTPLCTEMLAKLEAVEKIIGEECSNCSSGPKKDCEGECGYYKIAMLDLDKTIAKARGKGND